MFNDLFTHSIHRYERSNKNAESDEANYSKTIRRGVNKEAINNASRTQADGKYVSTKRYSCVTYKISNKNNIIIIIIIRDTGSYPNPVSKTKGLLPYFKIRFLWRRQNLKNANLRRSKILSQKFTLLLLLVRFLTIARSLKL